MNIYVRRKDTHERLLLESWGRSSEIYQYVNENLNPVYTGMEEGYLDITANDLDTVIKDVSKDIKSNKQRIAAYEKYIGRLVDYIDPLYPNAPKPKKGVEDNTEIEECISSINFLKEDIEELTFTLHHLEVLRSIQGDCDLNCNAFEGLSVNID